MLFLTYKLFTLSLSGATLDLEAFESNYDLIMQSKLELVALLLDYGCDPNRGLALTNRNKFVINTESSLFKLSSLSLEPNEAEEETGETPTESTTTHDNNNNNIEAKRDHLEFLCHQQSASGQQRHASLPVNQMRQQPISQPHLPSMLNTDFSFVTKALVDDKRLDALNATPIDSPLLLLCCVFNCHNLVRLHEKTDKSLSSSSHHSTSSKRRASKAGVSMQRRHTIHTLSGARPTGFFTTKDKSLISRESNQRGEEDENKVDTSLNKNDIIF